MPDKRFIYKGGKFPDPGIDPVCYSPGFFQIELELYVFYELRRKNGIEPARINQRQGFGERLSKYCVNKILDKGYACVELNVLKGNFKAERLFKKLGFVEVK